MFCARRSYFGFDTGRKKWGEMGLIGAKKGFTARAGTPGMANMFVKVLRTLFKYAIKEGYRTDNPAVNFTLWKLGEHRAWADEECGTFEARWAPGTMQRRAYMLAKYTGQPAATWRA